MQCELKVVIFRCGMKDENFAGDVYLNGKRIHCGRGHKNPVDATKEATAIIETFSREELQAAIK